MMPEPAFAWRKYTIEGDRGKENTFKDAHRDNVPGRGKIHDTSNMSRC